MEIKEFAAKVQRGLEKRLGAEAKTQLREVSKNNGVILHGLMIAVPDRNVSPTIYLEAFLEMYERGTSFGEIIDSIIHIYENGVPDRRVDMDFFRDFGRVKDRIAYKLVNAEKNRELLDKIPHILFLDLAVCFYYAYRSRELGSGIILIHNNHMEMWNTGTAELLRLAQENTARLFGEEITSMEDVVRELLAEEDGEPQAQTEERERFFREMPMRVLSNTKRLYGAACMLYPGLLERISGGLDAGLYILPSSVHEVILLPDRGGEEPGKLREMVREVNASQVEPEEFLSDNVYYFDRDDKNVKIIF